MVRLLRTLAIALLLTNGLSALAGGVGLIGDPSGRSLGLTTDMLALSPFENFLVPGIFLFVGNGLLSVAIAIITIKRGMHYPALVLFQGAFLCTWILIQMAMLQFYHLLHLICGVIGGLLIFCGYYLLQQDWPAAVKR